MGEVTRVLRMDDGLSGSVCSLGVGADARGGQSDVEFSVFEDEFPVDGDCWVFYEEVRVE
jgi:hypothetical protein